jgi:hypothetical protein
VGDEEIGYANNDGERDAKQDEDFDGVAKALLWTYIALRRRHTSVIGVIVSPDRLAHAVLSAR